MTLKILPLMYFLYISDIMFLIKCLKLPNSSFNINNFISFASGNTHLGTSNKLQHNRNCSVLTSNFTSIDYCGFGMHYPSSIVIFNNKKNNLLTTYGIILQLILILIMHVHIRFYVPVAIVTSPPNHLSLKHCSPHNNNHFYNIRNFFLLTNHYIL